MRSVTSVGKTDRRLIRLGAMLLAILPSTGAMAAVGPLGPAVELDSVSVVPKVAVDPSGRFGVLWDKDVIGVGVLATFDPAGRRLGPRRPIDGRAPRRTAFTANVAVDGGGDFLVTWQDNDRRRDETALHVRFFNFRGVPQSAPRVLVPERPGRFPRLGGAARNRPGEAVVVWEISGGERYYIRAQRFGAGGEPVGRPFNVRASAPGGPSAGYVVDPRVALDDSGRFVVAWRESGPDSGVDRLFYQRYGPDGGRRGSRRPLTRRPRTSLQCALAMEPGGELAAAWIDSDQGGPYRVRARWFDAFGRPLTGEVVVRRSADELLEAAVVRDRFGNTLVFWWRLDARGPVVEGRALDRLGEPLGGIFEVGDGVSPSAGIDDDGHFVVAWAGTGGTARRRPVFRRFRLGCAPGYESRCSR